MQNTGIYYFSRQIVLIPIIYCYEVFQYCFIVQQVINDVVYLILSVGAIYIYQCVLIDIWYH